MNFVLPICSFIDKHIFRVRVTYEVRFHADGSQTIRRYPEAQCASRLGASTRKAS